MRRQFLCLQFLFYFQTDFQMRASSTINLLNEFLVNKKESLGKGATGEVYSGKNLKTGTDVAVKVIDISTIDNEVTEYLLNMEKIAVMSVANPHVLRGIKIIQNNIYCYIVTELCNGGTLKNQIRVSGSLSEEKSLKILIQILKGECSLIGKGIVHRDLKPANILLHNGQAKIIDFGYCEIKGYPRPSLEYNVGSPSYMAPEAFMDNQYTEKSEVWAIGVTFYELLNGRTFDDGKNMSEVYRDMKKNGLPYRVKVSERCRKIINWCLEHDPKKRPTCVELLNFIVSEPVQVQRPPSQSTRVYFAPLDNMDIKVKLQSKLENAKPVSDYFSSEQYKKEDILKFSTSRDPKKPNERLKNVEHRQSLYQFAKTKYDRKPVPCEKKLVLRHKSQLFEAQANFGACMTDRIKCKENMFGVSPARTKMVAFLSNPNEKKPQRQTVNFDYFGMCSDR